MAKVATLLADAERPVLVIGSDVWLDGAELAAVRFAEEIGIPVITNGMGRGVLPRGHRLLVTRARSHAFRNADLVLVAGTPLDFRLGFGVFTGDIGVTDDRYVPVTSSCVTGSPFAVFDVERFTGSVPASGASNCWIHRWTLASTPPPAPGPK